MQCNEELSNIADSAAAPPYEKRKVRPKPPRDSLHEREVDGMIAAAGRNRHAVRDKALILIAIATAGRRAGRARAGRTSIFTTNLLIPALHGGLIPYVGSYTA